MAEETITPGLEPSEEEKAERLKNLQATHAIGASTSGWEALMPILLATGFALPGAIAGDPKTALKGAEAGGELGMKITPPKEEEKKVARSLAAGNIFGAT
mgnify:CR=1 FL=1